MVKESISAGQQGLQLPISGSDSLNLAGRATSDCPFFGQPPGISGWAHFASPLPLLCPCSPPTHFATSPHISVKSLTHLCLLVFNPMPFLVSFDGGIGNPGLFSSLLSDNLGKETPKPGQENLVSGMTVPSHIAFASIALASWHL